MEAMFYITLYTFLKQVPRFMCIQFAHIYIYIYKYISVLMSPLGRCYVFGFLGSVADDNVIRRSQRLIFVFTKDVK